MGKNINIFGVSMNSFVPIGNKKNDILVLGRSSTQGLDNTKVTAEAQYSINFSRSNRKFCLNLHYNGGNSFLFVNAIKIYQFKAKDSEIKKVSFVFKKYFRRFFSQSHEKTVLNGCVYDFSVDYRASNVINILK